MAERIKVDLTNATDEELFQIRTDVLRRIAERVRLPPGSDVAYDRHGSGHSKSSSIKPEQVVNPAVNPVVNPIQR
jgi:hypothetical protein